MFNHMALITKMSGTQTWGAPTWGALKPDTFPFYRSLGQYFAPNLHRIIRLVVHAEAQL